MEINDDWSSIFKKSQEKIIVMNGARQEIIEAKNYFGRPLLGKILILPRRNAEQFEYDTPWACISISDSYSPFDANIDENNRVDILRLKFDDTEYKERGSHFTKEQADQVLMFAFNVWENIDLLMIHCNAGISRSPAVGKFLSEIYQPDMAQYFSQLYSPNRLVLETLSESLNE